MKKYRSCQQIMDLKKYNFSKFYNKYYLLMCEGKIDDAKSLAEESIKLTDDPNVWMIYGRILLSLGQDLSAKAIFRENYNKTFDLHISDLIHARVKATIAIVDDQKKIVYIPIPKCGSTTVKGYIAQAIFNENSELDVHERLIGMHRVISHDELNTKYDDYFKFTIIRPACDRLRSYYTGNFVTGHVKKNSWNLSILNGLSTNPSPNEFMVNFKIYRQVYLDVRHHTDLLNGYIPPIDKIDVIYGISEIENIRLMLQDIYKINIAEAKKMSTTRSDIKFDIPPNVLDFYEQEEAIFEAVSNKKEYYI